MKQTKNTLLNRVKSCNYGPQYIQSGPKITGVFLKSDNFAATKDRKVCNTSNSMQFWGY